MCDYSLGGIDSRLAKVGEELVVHRFSTGSKGLTSPEYLKPKPKAKVLTKILGNRNSSGPMECAVCIPDGAKLTLFSTEIVTFRQLTEREYTHRDVLEFNDGNILSLQELKEGQRLQVLSLSSSEKSVSAWEREYLVHS